jgi:hypothetical protein
MEDSNLKSLLIGRLGSAITGGVALLAMFGTVVSPADVATIGESGRAIIDSGMGLFSAIMGAVSVTQVLISRYKKR